MLLLMIERDMPIDVVLFADTGMEFPEMYEYLKKLDAYGFVTSQYSSSAEACWERIEGHVLSLYPSADGKAIRSLLAMRMLTHASTTAR